MAVRNGSWSSTTGSGNRGRLRWEISQSPSRVSAGTSSVSLRLRVWYQSRYSISDSSNSYSITGSWSGSGSRSISHGGSGGQTLLFDGTITVSTSYANTVSRNFRASFSGINATPGIPSVSGSHTVSRRPVSSPNAPSNLTASRSSDSRANLSWTPRGSTARPYVRQRIRRRVNGGSWKNLATVSANASSYADTSIRAGNQYEYAVRAENAAGNSSFAYSGSVYTTPHGPSAPVEAKKLAGGDVRITWPASRSGYVTGYRIYDAPDGGGTADLVLVGTASGRSFTHVDPDPSVTHRYRITAVRGSLESGYSVWSNTVQLLARPSAPTLLRPTGTIDREPFISFAWRHNSVDTTDQAEYQLRYRVDGGSWHTISGTTAEARGHTSPGVSGVVEWQVRTRGEFPEWSPWSSVGSFELAAAPTVAINQPDGSDLAESRATLVVGYDNADGSPQSRVQAELVYDGVVLETLSWSGTADSGTFRTDLDNETEYTIHVRVQAGNGLWSEYDTVTFATDFPSPVPFEINAEWDRDSGAVILAGIPEEETLVQYAWEGTPNQSTSTRTTVDGTITNLHTNPDNVATSGEVVVWENLVPNPSFEYGTTNGWIYTSTATARVISTLTYPKMWEALGGRSGEHALQLSRTATAGSNEYLTLTSSGTPIAVSEGSWVGLSALVATETREGVEARLRIIFYPESGGSRTVTTDWESAGFYVGKRLVFAAQAEAGETEAQVSVEAVSRSGDSGNFRLWVDAVHAAAGTSEQAALEQVAVYFDGDTSFDSDLEPRWTGPPGSSTSQLVGQQVAGISAANGVVVQSRQWSKSGGVSARLIHTTGTGNSHARIDISPDAVETVKLWRFQDRTLTPTHDNFGRVGMGPTGSTRDYSSAAPNTSGEHLVTLNRDVAGNSRIYLYGDFAEVGGSVWFDALTAADAEDFEGDPFSGSSDSVVEAEFLSFQRRDSESDRWVTLAEDIEPGTEIVDPTPALARPEYRIISHTSLPSSATGPVLVVPWVHGRDPIFVNSGADYGLVCKAIGNQASDEPAIEQDSVVFAGVDFPVAIFGDTETYGASFTGTIHKHFIEHDGVSTRAEWLELLRERQVVCYRDCQGRKLYGLLNLSFSQSGPVETINISVDKVWHEEGVVA